MNRFLKMFLFAFVALFIISCGGNDASVATDSNRSVQYFPNMYESAGYETYQEGSIFPGNVEAQMPVEGTVSRGWMPYDYENNNDGYASAKANLKNPLPYTESNLENGAALYNIYCAICHGTKGDGQGHLVKTEKILGIPSYDTRDITQGSIYHVMYYGINYMGSYASQTSIEERWQIAHHVDALTRDLKNQPRMEFVTEGSIVDNTELDVENDASHNEEHINNESSLENESTTEGH